MTVDGSLIGMCVKVKSDVFFKNFENYLFIYVKFLKDFARVHAV